MRLRHLASVVLLLTACDGGGIVGPPGGDVPTAPTSVAALAGDAEVTLTWAPVDGASSYNVYWSTVSGDGQLGFELANATSPTVHDSLANGTTYYYVVTAVNVHGESAPSTEVSATPSAEAGGYASILNPVSLGTAPLAGFPEELPEGAAYHYTIAVNPGSVYMFGLEGAIDDVDMHVFSASTWGTVFGDEACVAYRAAKYHRRCVAVGPSSGTLYVGLDSESPYPESVTITVEEIVNEGEVTPVDLGTAPTAVHHGTVLNGGASTYVANVTPGATYRVVLDDWEDSGAATTAMVLAVYEGTEAIFDARLCRRPFGGFNASDKGTTAVCGTMTVTESVITVQVTLTSLNDWNGAVYDLRLEPAARDGDGVTYVALPAAPTTVTGEATSLDLSDGLSTPSYYSIDVTPNTDYLIDVRRFYEDLYLYVYSDAARTTQVCWSNEFNFDDEHCVANPGDSSTLYLMVGGFDPISTFYQLSVVPAPTGAVDPVRYPDEGSATVPVELGAAPVVARPSTVGVNESYYRVTGTPGAAVTIGLTDMNADLDVRVYSDLTLAERLCASINLDVEDESCATTFPASGSVVVMVSGDTRTDTHDWYGTRVGAVYRLDVQ